MQIEVKSETRLTKIAGNCGHLKVAERSADGTAKDIGDAPQVSFPSERQCRSGYIHLAGGGLPRNLRHSFNPRPTPEGMGFFSFP